VTNGRNHEALKTFLCWDETDYCKSKSKMQEMDLPTLQRAQREKAAKEGRDEL